jgi:uncharacterized protein (TIGR02145 family)
MKAFEFFILSIAILASSMLHAQVAISTDGSTADSSAMLEIKSTEKGMLFTRLTQVEIAAIQSPANGLLVYCTNDDRLYMYVSSEALWKEVAMGAGVIPRCEPFTDARDGKTYNTVAIGSQCWMAENLNIGTRIDGGVSQSQNTPVEIIEKYCYSDLETNCDIYGGLYQWDEMMQYSTTESVQGICPDGWHIPSDAEWTLLKNYIRSNPQYWCNNNSTYIAKAIASNTNWTYSSSVCAVGNNLSANNATGFSGMPGGRFNTTFWFISLGNEGRWWASSLYDSSNGYYISISSSAVTTSRHWYNKIYGLSVRCIRD